jgi:diguanylate cyclase (GGDEF)-like protein
MLLTDSQDAIAYVADGMLISANDVFAERFDYSSADDLDCLPIIDLIADSDHEKFKAMLKAQLGSDEAAELSINGLKQGGIPFNTTLQLANATFDGEPCVQLTLRDSAATGNGVASHHDDVTGLYSSSYFLGQLDNQTKLVAANGVAASLLFIRVNKFTELRSRLGINRIEQALIDLALFIQSQCDEKYCLAHYCDDAFTLLLDDQNLEQAKGLAQALCRSIESHIIELDSQSIQMTVSIGIIPIEPSIDERGHIDNAFSASELISNGSEVYIPPKERKSLGDANSDSELDATLAEAIEDGLFKLRYQPVVSLRGSAGDHYEVQVVMQDGDTVKTADEFLHSLNFTGINTRLDRWVILEATKELATKRDKGEDIRLFINLTYQALLDESLIPWLSVALKAGNLPAEALIFQFAENEIASNLKPAISFSAALQETGCRLSITDFGRMDDPLKNYKHINANFTRLCTKFTNELDNGGDSQALKAIVGSINECGGKAIIPNLQKAAALAVLWQVGADYIQGDYLAPPLNDMNYEFTDIA